MFARTQLTLMFAALTALVACGGPPPPVQQSSAPPTVTAPIAPPFAYGDAPKPVRAGERARPVAIMPIRWAVGGRIGTQLDTLGAESRGDIIAGTAISRDQMEAAVLALDRRLCDFGYDVDPSILDPRDTSASAQVVLVLDWKTLNVTACSNRGKPFTIGSASGEASIWTADGARSIVRRPLAVRTSAWGDVPTFVDSLAARFADAIMADTDLRLGLNVPRTQRQRSAHD